MQELGAGLEKHVCMQLSEIRTSWAPVTIRLPRFCHLVATLDCSRILPQCLSYMSLNATLQLLGIIRALLSHHEETQAYQIQDFAHGLDVSLDLSCHLSRWLHKIMVQVQHSTALMVSACPNLACMVLESNFPD